jgi:hypothetical protein
MLAGLSHELEPRGERGREEGVWSASTRTGTVLECSTKSSLALV